MTSLDDWEEGKLPTARMIVRLTSSVTRLSNMVGRAVEPIGFPSPNVARLFNMMAALQKGYTLVQFGFRAQAMSAFREASKSHPEAFIPFLLALEHAKNQHTHWRARRFPEARREALTVIDLGYRAADAPTLAPGSPHRYHSRILGVMADATVLEDDARRERLAAATLTGLAPGPLPAVGLARWAAVARDPARTERIIAQTRHLMIEGRRYRPTRRVLSPFLAMVVPPESARSLLIDWQLDEPDEPAMWRARTELELRTGNPSEALHYVDLLLAKQPGDGPALTLRRQALEELERQARARSR